jgi:hypothetical protein
MGGSQKGRNGGDQSNIKRMTRDLVLDFLIRSLYHFRTLYGFNFSINMAD